MKWSDTMIYYESDIYSNIKHIFFNMHQQKKKKWFRI